MGLLSPSIPDCNYLHSDIQYIIFDSILETNCLVTLSCCGSLPGFQIWRGRGNSPNGLIEKSLWHDTNQKSPFFFFFLVRNQSLHEQWKWRQAEQPRVVLGSQSGILQVLRSFLWRTYSYITVTLGPLCLVDALHWIHHLLSYQCCHSSGKQLLIPPGQSNWVQSDYP